MRKHRQGEWWAVASGSLELRQLALGLEPAMVGFLGTCAFCNLLLDVHWLFTLLILNQLLFVLGRQPGSRGRAGAVRA